MTTMLDSLANEIEAACNVRAYGLYDYSGYPEVPGGLKRHVVRDELTRGNQVVFESNDPSEAHQWYDAACRRFIARAALQAIRVPDAGMIEAGESAAWDKGNSMPTIRAMPIGYTAMIDAILSESA